MKKTKFTLLLGCILSAPLAFSQTGVDAYRYSRTELSGSARSVAMGGAFGALGGDIAALHTNPAGIGVYRTSEVVLSLNFMQNRTTTNMVTSNLSNSGWENKRFTTSLDNIGSVFTFDAGPYGGRLNLGFSYNKPFSYNNRYNVKGQGMSNYSLSNYIAQLTNRYNGVGVSEAELGNFSGNAPWLSILAWNTYLIDPLESGNGNTYRPTISAGELTNNSMYIDERGSIAQYSFSLGGSMLEDRLYLGMAFVGGTIDYTLQSYYDESFYNSGAGSRRGFQLYNDLSTVGRGFNMKLGAIVRPIDALRLGIAYHTPTWYSMTDYFNATLTPLNIYYVDNDGNDKAAEPYDTPLNEYSYYTFRSPGKWLLSAAGIISNKAIVSFDWEITDYRKMSLDYWGSSDINSYIESDFRTVHTLRAGAEFRLLPQLSLRGGFEHRPGPMKTETKNAVYNGELDIPTAGTIPNFTIDKGSLTYTFGLGYRFKNGFYTDIACALINYRADYYNFSPLPQYDWDAAITPEVTSTPASMKTLRAKTVVTVGYKF